MFKKPKKNIRRRNIGLNDDEPEEESHSVQQQEKTEIHSNKVKQKKKDKRQHCPLSFEEDLNDADDGVVFQVKKSSQSKKIMKLLDRERKKKKESKSADVVLTEETAEKLVEDTSDLGIVVKNTQMPPILNGLAAEMAEIDSESSEDEDNHKFSQPDQVKFLLERGHIPDAAMIHAARKRRQLAREMGGDYIPIETNVADSKSRLVREEDENDAIDDEERINMEINTGARDKEKIREAFLAAQGNELEELSDRGEDEEWESQQIRKGVAGAQFTSVPQQVAVYTQFVNPVYVMSQYGGMYMPMPETIPVSITTECESPEMIAKRLQDRLTQMKEYHHSNCHLLDQINEKIDLHEKDAEELEKEGPTLAERFRFYQELRGYVTDLVECLDEKVPVIAALEQRLLSLLKKRAEELMERRRQDIRDQAEEFTPKSKKTTMSTAKRNQELTDARARRVAEREGRRTRRRRVRELRDSIHHVEGMSSDDEMTELEVTAFRNLWEIIESDAKLVFDDVVDEFCSVAGIMKRFENWRNTNMESYKEAYASLNLTKILGPILRLKLLMWNPLQEAVEFERHKWHDTLLLYGLKDSETMSSLRDDPDVNLVPSIVEKIILTKLTKLVEAQWDPMSTSQTLRLVGLLNKMLNDYPTLTPHSKPLQQFMMAVIEKMKAAIENDIFIPLYPRQVLEMKGGSVGLFFQRQFGSAVKLLRNLLSWQGIVSDKVLQEVAVTSLLNRYLLAALRMCDPIDAAAKCNMIVSTFPRWWFQQSSSRPQLQMFINQLKNIAQSIDANTPAGRDAIENITKIRDSLETSVTTSLSST